MSTTTRPWVRRKPIVPTAPSLPVRGYAIAIAVWIALAALIAPERANPFDAIAVMALGPLNCFVTVRFDPTHFRFDSTPDYGFIGFYFGVIGFWLLQSLLRNSASPFLRATLLCAFGYAHIFAWGLCGVMFLGLGH